MGLTFRYLQLLNPLTDLAEFGIWRYFEVFISDIKSDFTFENFQNFVVRKHTERNDNFRKSRVLLDKLVAVVKLEILRSQK